MELIPRLLLVGLALACLAHAIGNDIVERPTAASPPPWRGSGLLSSIFSNAYETPTSSADEYTSLEPYSFYDTGYPISATPRPQYSAIVSVRTTTWVLSRSTTITSIILETYYSTLTDVEGSAEAGTVTVTTETTASPSPSTECTTASGYASVYANGCSSSSPSSSLSSSLSMVTMTWSPEVTAYPPPSSSNDEGASPASTSSESTTTTAAATSSGNESPPVVTGGAGSAAQVRTLGVVAALLAMLL